MDKQLQLLVTVATITPRGAQGKDSSPQEAWAKQDSSPVSSFILLSLCELGFPVLIVHHLEGVGTLPEYSDVLCVICPLKLSPEPLQRPERETPWGLNPGKKLEKLAQLP